MRSRVVAFALAFALIGCPSKPSPPPEPPPVVEPETPPEPVEEAATEPPAEEEEVPEPEEAPPDDRPVVELVGVMRMKGDDTWVLEGGGGRWCMSGRRLAAEFRKDGLRVRVRGVKGKIPPNVRMMCTPFEMKSIDAVK